MLPAALAGGGAARDVAAERGEPYGTIYTTTAGKKNDRDGKYAYQITTCSAVWSERFLDVADPTDFRACEYEDQHLKASIVSTVLSVIDN
jgi:hypothetical protein